MSHEELPASPASAIKLHDSIAATAQAYLYRPGATAAIRASLRDDIAAFRGHLKGRADRQGAALQDARAERAASFAAVSRLACDSVIDEALALTDEHGLDIGGVSLWSRLGRA